MIWHSQFGALTQPGYGSYLSVEIIMLPKRSELVLTSHIPDSELDVLVLQRLHIESDGGDGLDELVLFQFEEDRSLARTIETQSNDSHLDFGADVNSIILKF